MLVSSPRLPHVCVVLVVLIAGCGERPNANTTPAAAGTRVGASQPARADARKVTICLLPKKKGLPYFTSCAAGAAAAAGELPGVELIYDGPTDGSPEKAAAMIEKWTLQGVDAIAVSPNDPDVLAPAMQKARKKGVHVITWDADGLPAARELFVNQASARDIGNALVDTMAGDLGEGAAGEVAIVTAYLTAANQNAWIAHMKERLPQYPGLTLVAVEPAQEDQKLAFRVTQDLLKSHANLRGIFAISSVAFPGAAEAVYQAGKSGQVLVTGLSTPNDMRAHVKNGTVKSVILWNTADLGYLTVQTAYALAAGRLAPGAAGLDAGRLGRREIVDGNVLLGGLLIFTKENIDDFDF